MQSPQIAARHGMPDRIDDLAIAGAAAQIAAEPIPDRFVVRIRLAREQRDNGKDHAGGAETALERSGCKKRGLDAIQRAGAAKPFDRRDRATVDRERECGAGRRRERHR